MNTQNTPRVPIRHLLFCLLLFLGSMSGQAPPPEPGLVQLTNSPGENAIHPNWSPKGDFISFISNRGSNNGRMNDVWEVAPDKSILQPLTVMPDDGSDGGSFDAVWIGQTGDLVVLDVNFFFEWLRLQLSLNPALPVVRTAFDGPSPNFEELLTIPGGLGGLSFAVSHDGQFAAWSEMITPSSSCPWVTNAVVAPVGALNGQATTAVGSVIASASVGCGGIPKSEAIVGIAFSPDNSQVVLARASDPNVVGYDLEIYTTSGQFVRKLTDNGTGPNPVINWNPSWSSDGRIAFASNKTGRFEIYTIDPDETNLQPITTNGGDWPSWSPDSSRIAFQSTRSGNSEIYVIPASRFQEFAIFSGHATEPSIAADPKNPLHAVVGFNHLLDTPLESDVNCGWSESHDGGETWVPGDLVMPVGFIGMGDPWVRYSPDGKLYYSCMARTHYDNAFGFLHERTVGVVIAVSTTGAAADFSPPTFITEDREFCFGLIDIACRDEGELTDHPAITISQRSDGRLQVLACWIDAFVEGSRANRTFLNVALSDDGRMWSQPQALAADVGSCTVGANGPEVAITYFNPHDGSIKARQSHDGGAKWDREFTLSSVGNLSNGSTTSPILSTPYSLLIPSVNGGLQAIWQKSDSISRVFIGQVVPNSVGTPFSDAEADLPVGPPAMFLPGASGCTRLAGAYESTSPSGLFRYKVWMLSGTGLTRPIFSSGADLNPSLGDLDDRFPGFRRIGDYTSVDCSSRVGWAAWTDLRNGKPEIWGAVIPLP